jgi:hypothetical protein
MNSREAIYAALFAQLQTINANLVPGAPAIQTFARRFIPTSRVDLQPALLMVEAEEEYEHHAIAIPPKVALKANVLVYTRDGADPNAVSASNLNRILDSLEAALNPVFPGEQTLGGLVRWARIAKRQTIYDAAQDVTQATTTVEIHMLSTA